MTGNSYHDDSKAPEITAFVITVANTDPNLDLVEHLGGGVGQWEAGSVKAGVTGAWSQTGKPKVDHFQFWVVGRFAK